MENEVEQVETRASPILIIIQLLTKSNHNLYATSFNEFVCT